MFFLFVLFKSNQIKCNFLIQKRKFIWSEGHKMVEKTQKNYRNLGILNLPYSSYKRVAWYKKVSNNFESNQVLTFHIFSSIEIKDKV